MYILYRLRLLVAIVLCLFLVDNLSAQEELPVSMHPSTPPTPQATAITRLAEYKANNWTGTPDIGISLFDFDCDGYIIPLRLSYEARPMRPGHDFDVYGRGWMLSGGSCVSRTIRSLPDEVRDFKIADDYNEYKNKQGGYLHEVVNLKSYVDYYEKMKHMNDYNYQSDMFNVVLPNGRSIDFVIQGDRWKNLTYIKSLADKDVIIKCKYSTTSIDCFEVIDESGIKYEFGIADRASNGYLSDRLYYNVTWLLTKITLTNGRTIHYVYNDVKQINHDNYNDLPIRTYNEPCLTFGSVFFCKFEKKERPYWVKNSGIRNCPIYYEHLLSRISCESSYIDFNYSKTVSDLITDITVKDGRCGLVRKFDFDVNVPLRQLKKLSISGTGKDTLNYSFKYSSQNPGDYTDHWGNYGNGSGDEHSTGYTLDIGNFNFFIHREWHAFDSVQYLQSLSNIRMMDKTKADNNDYTYKFKLQSNLEGDSRKPSPPSSHGVLTSITYPNGGSTSFTFENHCFLTASMEDGSLQFDRRKRRIVEGGGFRIKSICNYDASNKLVDQFEYCYGPTYGDIRSRKFPFPDNQVYASTQHTGCGEPVVDPNVLTYLDYDKTAKTPSCFREMIAGVKIENGQANFANYDAPQHYQMLDWWYECRFSAMNFRKLLGGRPAVVYPEITVYHGRMIDPSNPLDDRNDISEKTVYKFDIYSYNSPQTYLNQVFHKYAPDTTYFEPVFYYNNNENILHVDEHKSRRNRLVSVTEYAHDKVFDNDVFRLRQTEKYNYQDNENSVTRGYIYNNRYNLEHPLPKMSAYDYYLKEKEKEKETETDDWPHSPSEAVGSTMQIGELYCRISEYIGHSQLVSKKTDKTIGVATYNRSFATEEHMDYTLGDNIKSHDYDDKGVHKYDTQNYVYNSSDTTGVIPRMKSLNMLALPLSGNTKVWHPNTKTTEMEGHKIDYAEYTVGKTSMILPSVYKTLYGKEYEDRLKVVSYTKYGKPQEVKNLKTGETTLYLWGYGYRYLIAEIHLREDSKESILHIQDEADRMEQEAWDGYIRNSFPASLIKTYTYRPQVGVTTVTDETGQTVYYDYDGLGRLTETYMMNGERKERLNSYTYDFPNR